MSNLAEPIKLDMPREWRTDSNETITRLGPKKGVIYNFNTTRYLGVKITSQGEPSKYDLNKNGIKLEVEMKGEETSMFLNKVVCNNDSYCDFELPQVFQNITGLSIQNLCDFISVVIQIEVYEVTCKYYNQTLNTWQQNGVYSGIQEEKNGSICLTNHLTTFGALTVPRKVSDLFSLFFC